MALDWNVDNLDSFINDQVQNALAFYSVVEDKPAVPTISQLQNPTPIATQVFAPGNSGSLLVVALVVVAVVVLMRVA